MPVSSILLFISFFIVNPLIGQKIIHGHIADEQTKKAIPFANIGVLNSNVGTISNEDGSFSIYIPAGFSRDTIIFSAIGYAEKKILLSHLNDNQDSPILLSVNPTMLEAVTVTAVKKTKEYWLGNRYFKGGSIYADSITAGSAMALLIENKYPSFHKDFSFPAYINKAMLRISDNTFEEFKVRIRILEVDTATHLPGKDLFDKNVIVTSRIKKGWLPFDLSSFQFKVNKPFFLVFEWILEDDDRINLVNQFKEFQEKNPDRVTRDTMMVRGEKVPFNSYHNFVAGTFFGVSPIQFSLNNYQSYYRNNSFGAWEKASAILTARILLTK